MGRIFFKNHPLLEWIVDEFYKYNQTCNHHHYHGQAMERFYAPQKFPSETSAVTPHWACPTQVLVEFVLLCSLLEELNYFFPLCLAFPPKRYRHHLCPARHLSCQVFASLSLSFKLWEHPGRPCVLGVVSHCLVDNRLALHKPAAASPLPAENTPSGALRGLAKVWGTVAQTRSLSSLQW